MKIRRPYPFVHEFLDRHGRPRVYLRKRGHKRMPLPWPIGTREFVEAYQAAMGDCPAPIGQSRTKPGSINALVQLYYCSPEWIALAPQSQRTYRHILERFREEHGDKPVMLLGREHVKAMVDAKAATPAAANKFRKLLLVLMRVAVDRGWRKDNPVSGVKGIRTRSLGFQTWSEAHIAQFEATHAIGTRARLALALLLYTGQRRGDVVRMGRQHIRDGVLSLRQQKTGMEVSIPLHPKLHECLTATSREHLTFLVTEYGQPFTPAGFTNWFREKCSFAGLHAGLSPHGLRKACADAWRKRDALRTRSWQSAVTKASPRSLATQRQPTAHDLRTGRCAHFHRPKHEREMANLPARFDNHSDKSLRARAFWI
jgi:integrase